MPTFKIERRRVNGAGSHHSKQESLSPFTKVEIKGFDEQGRVGNAQRAISHVFVDRSGYSESTALKKLGLVFNYVTVSGEEANAVYMTGTGTVYEVQACLVEENQKSFELPKPEGLRLAKTG